MCWVGGGGGGGRRVSKLIKYCPGTSPSQGHSTSGADIVNPLSPNSVQYQSSPYNYPYTVKR